MSLGQIKVLTNKIGFRIGLAYLGVFLLSAVALFAALYFLLGHSLDLSSSRLLDVNAKRYSFVLERTGLPGLKQEVEQETPERELKDLLIRVEGKDGQELYSHFPSDIREYGSDDVINKIHEAHGKHSIHIVSKEDSEDAIDIIQQTLPDGLTIQIGSNSESKELVFDSFREGFLIITILCLTFGYLGALLLTRKILGPIRSLISTISLIMAGSTDARVKRTNNGDELDELSSLFNQMLDKNMRLIQGMKDSLDNVAHDLRTPMTRFYSLAEVALSENGRKNPDALAEALSEALESSAEILQLLNLVMDISEAEAGSMHLNKHPMNAKVLLENVQDLYGMVAEDKKIKITIEAENITINVDDRIRQVIANLLDNAIKFSPDNSTIFLRAFTKGENKVLQVEDNGPGISTEEQIRIWERLYRGDKSRSTKGAGLGLSLVKSIIEAHGGTVSVQSTPGKGSIFTVILP